MGESHRVVIRLLTLASLLLVASCDLMNPGGPSEDRQRLSNELDRRLALWKGRALTNYDFNYRRICFCDTALTKQVRVSVRGGVIASVKDTLGVIVAPGVPWPTVDSLFAVARGLVDNQSYNVSVAFNDSLDYPAFISGDIPLALDDEFVHRANSLVVAAPMVVAPKATAGTGKRDSAYWMRAPAAKSNSVTWRKR